MSRWWIGVCLVLAASLAGGCSNVVDQDQVHIRAEETVILKPGHSVGQSFVAQHAGLVGIDMYLFPALGAEGTVALHLYQTPSESSERAVTSVSVESGDEERFHRFSFPPIPDSHSGYYYAVLEYTGTEHIELATGDLDTYDNGTLYYDGEPHSSQTVFKLVYDRGLIVRDLLLLGLRWMGYGAVAVGFLFLAGYPLIRGWGRRADLDFTSLLILGAASVLALWMVFLVWARVIGLRLNTRRVRLIAIVGVLLGLWYFIQDRDRWRKRAYWTGNRPYLTLALWIVVMLSIGLRLFVGRGMVMLPGSDTYHHTMIAQLFVEQGGIPESYEPYAPLTTFSYHWGFHSIVALFRWLFGRGMLGSTKTIALVMNGGIAAAAGMLCEKLVGARRGSIWTAALVGLVAASPFCLLRWGRFTQTAGLLFLGPALWATLIGSTKGPWHAPSLLVSALVLSHYRVAFLWGVFSVLAGGTAALKGRWSQVRNWLIMGAISIALTSPWLIHVLRVQQDPYGMQLHQPVLGSYNDLDRLEDPVLSFVTNIPFLVGTLLLTGVACIKEDKKPTARLLTGWCVLLYVGAVLSPRVLGTSFWDLKSTLLTLPLPLAVTAGLGAEALSRPRKGGWWHLVEGILLLVLAGGVIIGITQLPGLAYGGPVYLRAEDLSAMEWIRENTATDARFLVDGIEFEWSPGWIVGIDAGYWIPLLTGRRTTVPPMIYPLEWSKSASFLALGPSGQILTSSGTIPGSAISKELGFGYVYTDKQHWLGETGQQLRGQLQEVYREGHIEIFQTAE